MKKRERLETQRGLKRLREEIEAFALATEPGVKIQAFTRAMKRYRAVLARTSHVPPNSQQLEKDIYLTLKLVAKCDQWMGMWRAESALLKGVTPAQTTSILEKFPAYLSEMKRVYALLVDWVADQQAREAQEQAAMAARRTATGSWFVEPGGPKQKRSSRPKRYFVHPAKAAKPRS